MPQEFHVVRCFKCEAFQVHIVKKVPKWDCKICGEKQSVRQVYGKGTGKDCRLHVQKLNALRADEIPNNIEEPTLSDEEFYQNASNTEVIATVLLPNDKPKQSKWDEFLDDDIETNDGDNVDENIYPTSKKFKPSDRHDLSNSYYEFNKQSETDFKKHNQRTIYSYFTSDQNISQKPITENVPRTHSEDCIEHLKPSRSRIPAYNEQIKFDFRTDTAQLCKKTVFESFKETDNLDSILDTDF